MAVEGKLLTYFELQGAVEVQLLTQQGKEGQSLTNYKLPRAMDR